MNIGLVVLFLMLMKCYGILWDIYLKMIFCDDVLGVMFWVESVLMGVDYYFVVGGMMDGVVVGY